MKEAATTKSLQNVNIWQQAFNLTMLEICQGLNGAFGINHLFFLD